MVIDKGLKSFKETAKNIKSDRSNKVDSIRGVANVATVQTAIAHNLGRVPKMVLAMAQSNAYIYQTSPPTNTTIFLAASSNTTAYWKVE